MSEKSLAEVKGNAALRTGGRHLKKFPRDDDDDGEDDDEDDDEDEEVMMKMETSMKTNRLSSSRFPF
jgi:hypothetical protein